MDRLYVNWGTAVSQGKQYHDTPGGQIHVFHTPLDLPLPQERRKVWNMIDAARTEMRKALDDILQRLRQDYIEVNLHETNASAWTDYVTFQKEVRQVFDDGKTGTKRPRKK